jgi:hypothetical protein
MWSESLTVFDLSEALCKSKVSERLEKQEKSKKDSTSDK